MQFLGTRVIGNDIDSQYIVADVVSDGATLPHSVNVDEYITNLLDQIKTLKAELKSADEGLKLFHSIASNGEQSVLSRLDGGADVQDAVNWQDEPTIEDITVNGYAFNSKHAKIENDMRQKLADEYNKLFK